MSIIFLIGRIIFGGYFVISGVNHFRSLNFMAGYAESKGIPVARASVILSGLLLLAGGAGIVLGIAPKIAILLLVTFLLPTTLIMHDFWNAGEDEAMSEQINFMKNFALMGALLMLLAMSTGWPLSL
jgi:uncharacterized membrane protein YphA (DoxX/SURF4 family)